LVFKFWSWKQAGLWDGRHNFNFVVWQNNQFLVISYRSGIEEVNILQVSPETYIPLAKGFGEYPAGSIWQLGELEKIGGGPLLQFSSQQFLQIPVQGWGKVSSRLIRQRPDQSLKLNKKDLLFLTFNLLLTEERNLTSWDIIRLLSKINSLPASKINFYSLDKTRAGEWLTLPDGSRAFKIQKEFLKTLVKELYKDREVLNEAILWTVVNKIGVSGLAAQVVAIIDNLGGEVVGFYDQKESKAGGIYCQKEVCRSYTVGLLSRTLKLTVKKEILENSHAEALVVLDEDYWRFFYQR